MNRFNQKFLLQEEAPPEGSSAGAAQPAYTSEQVEKLVRSAVEEATGKLLGKRDELMDELKATKAKLKSYGDLDPDKIRAVMQHFNQNEEAKLVAEGKFDEVIDRRTDKLRSDFEARYSELQGKYEEVSKEGDSYRSRYQDLVISQQVQAEALRQGVRPEAIQDVIYRAKGTFSINPDTGELEARDNAGRLVKMDDHHILTLERYISSLKQQAPHYWPESHGTGSRGAGRADRENLEARLLDAAASGDMVEYRRLSAELRNTGGKKTVTSGTPAR